MLLDGDLEQPKVEFVTVQEPFRVPVQFRGEIQMLLDVQAAQIARFVLLRLNNIFIRYLTAPFPVLVGE